MTNLSMKYSMIRLDEINQRGSAWGIILSIKEDVKKIVYIMYQKYFKYCSLLFTFLG